MDIFGINISQDFIIGAIVVVCIIIASFFIYFDSCQYALQKTVEIILKPIKREPPKPKPQIKQSTLGDNLQRLEKSVNNQFANYDYGLATDENNDQADSINDDHISYVPTCELDPEFTTSRERIGACTTRKRTHKRCQINTNITEEIDDESRMAVQPCNKVDESVIYKVLYNR